MEWLLSAIRHSARFRLAVIGVQLGQAFESSKSKERLDFLRLR